jgi:hypothetical protein
MFWCILVFFNHHSLMRVILSFRRHGTISDLKFLVSPNWKWWVQDSIKVNYKDLWLFCIYFNDILYNFDCCITDTATNSSSQKDKLDRSVMSKSQNAPVTDQDKLDRSVISKDHTGNRKLNLEMVYRSML